MKLLDIISLAKAGYKKSDIDELLKIEVDEHDQDDNHQKRAHQARKAQPHAAVVPAGAPGAAVSV